MVGKRLPTYNNSSVQIKLPEEVVSSTPNASKPINGLKLRPNKENTSTASTGPSNANSTKSPNWREVGNYVDTLAKTQDKLEVDSVSDSLLFNNKNPLRIPLKYRICNHCQRPILDQYLEKHIRDCIDLKKNTPKANGNVSTAKKSNGTMKNENDTEGSKTPSASVSVLNSPAIQSGTLNTQGTVKNPRKRKIDKEREKEEARQLRELKKQQKIEERKQKKLKKKEKEKEQKEKEKESKKLQKQLEKKKTKTSSSSKLKKGPVDVEKQCGVPLQNGGFCARSLTCKTHSMGAKRAVPGRSASYDALLAAYQRKNQVKLLAGAALAQAEKDDLAHGGSQYLDSDEETYQVMEGVKNSYAMPIVSNHKLPTRTRTKYVRMREFYSNGIGNGRMSSSAISGRVAFFNMENPDEYVIKPRVYNAVSIQQQQYLAQKQQLLAQQKQYLQQKQLQMMQQLQILQLLQPQPQPQPQQQQQQISQQLSQQQN